MFNKLNYILLALFAAIVIFMVTFSFGLYDAAHGKNWDSESNVANNIKMWYINAQRNENKGSCCGEADAYWADYHEMIDGNYVVTITDERNIHNRIPRNGQKIVIPPDKVDKLRQGNPTGHSIVFMGSANQVYCFFPDWGA